MAVYQKVCHWHKCRKPFESSSRNTKYCSDPCGEAAKKVHVARQSRRRDYKRNAEDRRAQSMSRKQAREFCIATHAISVCTRCGNALQVAKLEDHHRDGNPFHNDSDNLTLVCGTCHPKSDTEWRKAKEVGEAIPDMRNFKQVGCVMVTQSGVRFVVIGDERYIITNLNELVRYKVPQ